MTIRKISGFTGQALALALIITAIGFSQPASAAPCSAELDALKTALDSGICQRLKSKKFKSRKFKSKKHSSWSHSGWKHSLKKYSRRNCMGLDHKLDNTSRKLEQGKFRHAARKLTDFGSVIEDMAMRRKPKISIADYEGLMDPYYVAAANCIVNGGTPTPPVADDSDPVIVDDEPPPPITVQF